MILFDQCHCQCFWNSVTLRLRVKCEWLCECDSDSERPSNTPKPKKSIRGTCRSPGFELALKSKLTWSQFSLWLNFKITTQQQNQVQTFIRVFYSPKFVFRIVGSKTVLFPLGSISKRFQIVQCICISINQDRYNRSIL